VSLGRHSAQLLAVSCNASKDVRVSPRAFLFGKAMAKKQDMQKRFWSKVEIKSRDECWPWIASKRKPSEGYGAFYVNGQHRPAPRYALILSGTEYIEGMLALHHCDNPNCCNPLHIYFGTIRDNENDKIKRNRRKGSKQSTSKLTEENVKYIRSIKPLNGKRLNKNIKHELSKKYGVQPRYIVEVMNRGWEHV